MHPLDFPLHLRQHFRSSDEVLIEQPLLIEKLPQIGQIHTFSTMGAVTGVENWGIYVKSWVNHLLLIGEEAPEISLTPIQELLCNRETGGPVDLPWLPL